FRDVLRGTLDQVEHVERLYVATNKSAVCPNFHTCILYFGYEREVLTPRIKPGARQLLKHSPMHSQEASANKKWLEPPGRQLLVKIGWPFLGRVPRQPLLPIARRGSSDNKPAFALGSVYEVQNAELRKLIIVDLN